MKTKMKRLAALIIVVGAFGFLLTCENGFNIVEEIETEVKVANDKFLVIKSVSPSDLASNINPGSEITIVFDREINLSSLTDSALTIYNETLAATTEHEIIDYKQSTNILTIEPTRSYFQTNNDYTIRISGIKGRDGSELQAEYTWSFRTGIAPAGSIIVVDRSGDAESGFTNEIYVDVSDLSTNPYVDDYYVSGTESDVSAPESIAESDWQSVDEDDATYEFTDIPISNTEGVVNVYFVFRGLLPDSSLGYSKSETVTIIYDNTAPIVSAGEDRIANSTITQTGSVTEENVNSILWSGSSLSFGSPNSITTTISASSDGTYTAQLTVTDKAGNSAFDEMDFTKDTISPSAATVTAPAGPSTDTSPTFTWTGDSSDGSGNFYVYYYTYSYNTKKSSYTYLPGNTTTAYYTPSITVSRDDRVLCRVHVKERDAAGNWSDDGNDSVLLTNYLPYNTQTGVSNRPTFVWPNLKGATYDLQFYSIRNWTTKESGLTDSYCTLKDSFSSGSTITWRIVTHYLKNTYYSDPLTFEVK